VRRVPTIRSLSRPCWGFAEARLRSPRRSRWSRWWRS